MLYKNLEWLGGLAFVIAGVNYQAVAPALVKAGIQSAKGVVARVGQ
jgi:hypothetical protein